jgi:F0F1-type ATP synthase assembly protein I
MIDNPQPSPNNYKAADLGISFLVCILLCGAAGYGLDHWLGSKPWGILGGIFLGFAAWLWQMWQAFNAK